LEWSFFAMNKNQNGRTPAANGGTAADKTLEDALKLAVSGHRSHEL
jgi:hypothetical protein